MADFIRFNTFYLNLDHVREIFITDRSVRLNFIDGVTREYTGDGFAAIKRYLESTPDQYEGLEHSRRMAAKWMRHFS